MSKWLKDTWKHVAIHTKIYKQGQGELSIPEINVELSIGLISTGSKEEFSKLVFHLAPLGIIVDEIDDEYYEGQLLKLRNLLTRELIRSPNSKIAEKYLNVLERRDRAHWAKETKETKVTATDSKGSTMDVTFTVVE
jgi:hypothetical protein